MTITLKQLQQTEKDKTMALKFAGECRLFIDVGAHGLRIHINGEIGYIHGTNYWSEMLAFTIGFKTCKELKK